MSSCCSTNTCLAICVALHLPCCMISYCIMYVYIILPLTALVDCSTPRYRLFAEPPLPDEEGGHEALQALSQPMDLLTMLYKVRV
jgi:hypothetical protein